MRAIGTFLDVAVSSNAYHQIVGSGFSVGQMPHVPGVHYIKYTMADNHRFFCGEKGQQFPAILVLS